MNPAILTRAFRAVLDFEFGLDIDDWWQHAMMGELATAPLFTEGISQFEFLKSIRAAMDGLAPSEYGENAVDLSWNQGELYKSSPEVVKNGQSSPRGQDLSEYAIVIEGDFTDQNQPSKLKKLFDSDFPPSFYRMSIHDLVISESGDVLGIPASAGETESYTPEFIQVDLSQRLQPGQHHGTLDIYSGRQLVSLFPREKLVGVWTEENPGMLIEVLYERSRGLYRVLLPETPHVQKTRVHFVVEEDKSPVVQRSLLPLQKYQAPMIWIDRLDELFERKPYIASELGNHQSLTPGQRMSRIIAYVEKFTKPPEGVTHLNNMASNIDLLAELVETRMGTCRHMAYTAAALAAYYGIPARILSSETHSWIEYSLNNGDTWQTAETWGTYGRAENREDSGDSSLISSPDPSQDEPVSSEDVVLEENQQSAAWDYSYMANYIPDLSTVDGLIARLMSWWPDSSPVKNVDDESACKELVIENNPDLWYEAISKEQEHRYCQNRKTSNPRALLLHPYQYEYSQAVGLTLVKQPVQPEKLSLVAAISGKPEFFTPDQYHQQITLKMTQGEWYRLPALVYARTVDALWVESGKRPDLAFEPETGFYLVSLSEGEMDQELTIHYLLVTGYEAVISEGYPDSQPNSGRFDEPLEYVRGGIGYRDGLSYDDTWKRMSLLDRISLLQQHFKLKTREGDASLRHGMGSLENLFSALFILRRGNSLLTSTLFSLLLEEMNVKTRIIAGELYAIAEFSLDNGEHWITAQLSNDHPGIPASEGRTDQTIGYPVADDFMKMVVLYEQKHGYNRFKDDKALSFKDSALNSRPSVLVIPDKNPDGVIKSRYLDSHEGMILGLNVLREAKVPNPEMIDVDVFVELIEQSDVAMLPYLKSILLDISPPPYATQQPWRNFLTSLLNKGRRIESGELWPGLLEFILLDQEWLNSMDWPEELLVIEKSGIQHPLLQTKLDGFYQKLTTVLKAPVADSKQDVQDPDTGIIEELASALVSESFESQWNSFPEGGLDINRLVKRQPAFRKTVEGRATDTRPVVMILHNPAIVQELISEHFHVAPGNKEIPFVTGGTPAKRVETFIESFMNTVKGDLWMVQLYSPLSTGLHSPVNAGEFSTLTTMSNPALKNIDVPRLLKRANMTDAVVIDDEKLKKYFRAYVENHRESLHETDSHDSKSDSKKANPDNKKAMWDDSILTGWPRFNEPRPDNSRDYEALDESLLNFRDSMSLRLRDWPEDREPLQDNSIYVLPSPLPSEKVAQDLPSYLPDDIESPGWIRYKLPPDKPDFKMQELWLQNMMSSDEPD